MNKFNLIGKKFGMLTVIGKSENQGRRTCWLCKCDCGNEKIIKTDNLIRGFTKSCGCSSIKLQLQSKKVDMHSEDRLYKIYYGIKRRCNKPNIKYYSSKGITLCEEWDNDYNAFYKWAISNGYKDNLSIDRINSNGNYCPSNCRWVDRTIQNRNRSLQSNNKSGYAGVVFIKECSKYRVTIGLNGSKKSYGLYKTLKEAINARIKAENKYWGNYR